MRISRNNLIEDLTLSKPTLFLTLNELNESLKRKNVILFTVKNKSIRFLLKDHPNDIALLVSDDGAKKVFDSDSSAERFITMLKKRGTVST